jgi:hypothetical protein
MADQDDGIDGLEAFRQQGEEAEPDRGVPAGAILVGDDPRQDATGTEDPSGLRGDSAHLLVESRIAARDSAQTPRIVAIPDVVRIR